MFLFPNGFVSDISCFIIYSFHTKKIRSIREVTQVWNISIRKEKWKIWFPILLENLKNAAQLAGKNALSFIIKVKWTRSSTTLKCKMGQWFQRSHSTWMHHGIDCREQIRQQHSSFWALSNCNFKNHGMQVVRSLNPWPQF